MLDKESKLLVRWKTPKFKRSFAKVIIRPSRYESLLVSILLLTGTFGSAATVNGRIVSDKGGPAARVVVTIHRSLSDGIVPRDLIYQTVTDDSGAFSLSVSDPGNYVVCAGSAQAELLDSCLWPNDTATFSVSDPGASKEEQQIGVKVVLPRGATLRYRVADAAGLLPRPQGSEKAAFLQIGVWTKDGHYCPARLVSHDDEGLNYEITVPLAADLKVSLQAVNVRVLDDKGLSLDSVGPALSVLTQATDSVKIRTFTVVPKN